MRSAILVIIVVGCVLISCNKNTNGIPIRGKLVYNSCATSVVQVLDPEHFHIAQSSWKQSPGAPTYLNVFSVANKCGFRNGKDIAVGDIFYFSLSKDHDTGCAVCDLWDNPPTITQRIKLVSK